MIPEEDENNILRVISVVGARPNFTKIVPIIRAINKHDKELYTLDCGHRTTDCFFAFCPSPEENS